MSEPRRLKGIAKGRKRKKEDPFPLSIDGSGAAHIFSIARFSARFPCRRSQVNDTPSRHRRAAVFAAPRGAIAKGIFSSLKRISPLEPQDRGGLSTVAAKRFPRSFGRANRAAASKAPRFFRHWRRFGAFPLNPRTPMLVSEFPHRYVSVFSDDLTYFSFRCRSLCTVMFPSATPFAAGMHLVRKLT